MCDENWDGTERREQEFLDAEQTVVRHADQAIAAVRMNSFLNTLDKYKPVVLSALFCFFVILATMAYGIVNTNNRATENSQLFKEAVRCVAELTNNRTAVDEIPECKQFRKE